MYRSEYKAMVSDCVFACRSSGKPILRMAQEYCECEKMECGVNMAQYNIGLAFVSKK